MDGLVSLGTGRVGENVGYGDGASVGGLREGRPVFALIGQANVGSLHFFARAAALHAKIEANEGEGELDRLGGLVRVLDGVGVDDVLMDERGIRVRQRVVGELVVLFLMIHAMPL